LRFNCKVWPGAQHPAFPKEAFHWAPLVNVRLIYHHSPPTKFIECFVDSGAHSCMFHAAFCRSLGIHLEDSIKSDLGGVVGGVSVPIYYHRVKVLVGSQQLTTMAGFSDKLSVAGLLGRRGFFDDFIVRIDSSTTPPSFDLDKINRA
jgi:hypothetical protein